LISLIAVVVILGFMILIHEFGHYAVAKWLGVRVEQFAIGFGKRLVGFRKGRPTIASARSRWAATSK
jgi:regulator of sigma E protease